LWTVSRSGSMLNVHGPLLLPEVLACQFISGSNQLLMTLTRNALLSVDRQSPAAIQLTGAPLSRPEAESKAPQVRIEPGLTASPLD
ncbi:MAG: hypothetical protein ACKVKF_23275, partial [Rhodobacterales bacterium]